MKISFKASELLKMADVAEVLESKGLSFAVEVEPLTEGKSESIPKSSEQDELGPIPKLKWTDENGEIPSVEDRDDGGYNKHLKSCYKLSR